MERKPTYEELEKRARDLERKQLINKQSEEDLEYEIKKFGVLYDIAIAMTANHKLDENLRLVVDNTRELLGTDASYIALRDDISGDVYMHSLSGVRTEAFKKMRISFGKGLGGLIAETRRGHIIEDYFNENKIDHVVDDIVAAEGVISVMGVPIQIGNETLGVLCVYNRKKTVFSKSDLDTLSLIGNIAAVEISRKQVGEALVASEQRLADIVNFLPDATFAIDLEGKVIAWNRAIEEMTGIKSEDIMGKGNYEYALPFYGTRRPILIDIALKPDKEMEGKYLFVRREGESLLAEPDVISLSGRKVFLWGKAGPMYDHEGNIIGAIESIRDVTDRKHAVEAMRKSENRYRALFDNNPVDTVIVNREGKITEYNLAKKGSESRLPNINSDVMYRDYAAKHETDMFGELMQCIRSGVPKKFVEQEYKNKFLDINMAPLPDGAIITSIDVTDRKHAEEELRNSEARYRSVFENTGTAMIIIDEDKTIILSNAEIENLSGYSREEVDGKKKWTDFVAKGDLGKMNKYHSLRRVDPTSAPRNYECRFVDRYGEVKDVYITIDIIPGTNRSVASFMDITDRKRTEQKLKESESRYRSVFENTGTATIIIDEDRTLFMVNNEFEKLSGYSREEIEGKKQFIEFLAKEDLEKMKAYHVKRRKTGEDVPNDYEFRFVDRNGNHKDISLKVGLIPGTKKSVASLTDITILKESLKEKEVLLQEIHHRVKNNMQIVSSLLNLQSQHVKDKESLEMFNESRDRIFSMASVHEKLYQSGDLTRIDFCHYIKDLSLYLFRIYNVERSSVKLNINFSDLFLDVNKAVPCGLIINELLSNSLKHAFPRGRKGNIDIDFYLDSDNGLTLNISDNGIGLPKDIDMSKEKTLGLRLVRILVAQLKGTIEIERNGGTTFKIKFGL